jgi:hypothetical protein
LESVVCQYKYPAVVRFQIVDLFAKDQLPEVFADEFDGVEVGLRAGFVDGESGG